MAPGATVTQLHEQLTFEVGGTETAPGEASLSISGSGELAGELYLDDDVVVKVTTADGKTLAAFSGTVVDVGFKKHPVKKDRDGIVTAEAFVERKHRIKLTPDED